MIYQYSIAASTLLIPMLAGVAILSSTRIFQQKIKEFVVGSTFGITLFGTILFCIARFSVLTTAAIWSTLGLFAFFGTVLTIRNRREKSKRKVDYIALGIACVLIIISVIIGQKLLIERPNGLYTGVINAYGDLPWHTALITELAQQKTLPIQNPIFAKKNLTYPLVADLISSAMLTLGSSIPASVNVPPVVLMPIVFLLIYYFGATYGTSRAIGSITLVLFLFGGATFGWLRIIPDFQQSDASLLSFIVHLPDREYVGTGGDAYGFHFLNAITSLLLPQRSLLFGIPIVLSILLLLHPKKQKNKYAPILAGVLAGMLPLFHAHACIALFAALIVLFVIHPNIHYWRFFLVPAIAIGIPEVFFYILGSAESGSFFKFDPWWTKGDRNVFIFWIQNTGLLIPASIVAFFTKTPRYAKALLGAGLFLFILANTFLFAPWAWDNFKLLIFWFIFSLPGIAWVYLYIWKHSWLFLRPLLAVILLLHITAGMIDIWKLILPTKETWQEWDSNGIRIAQAMQAFTPASSIMLAAPVHNSPVALTGRATYLGFPGHIWSHGGLPWEREEEVKNYLLGTGETIAGENPKYILVGPQERFLFPGIIIRPSWEALASYGAYTLYINN